jgi:hypothetical protein
LKEFVFTGGEWNGMEYNTGWMDGRLLGGKASNDEGMNGIKSSKRASFLTVTLKQININ